MVGTAQCSNLYTATRKQWQIWSKRKQEGEWLPRMGEGIWDQLDPCVQGAPSQAKPQSAPGGPKSGTGSQGGAGLEGRWEETKMENKQAAEKKSHLKTLGWTLVTLPRCSEGTRMTWIEPKGWGKERREIWQLRRNISEDKLGTRVCSLHRTALLGSELKQKCLAPFTLLCGLPVKCENKTCCSGQRFSPAHGMLRARRAVHTQDKEDSSQPRTGDT